MIHSERVLTALDRPNRGLEGGWFLSLARVPLGKHTASRPLFPQTISRERALRLAEAARATTAAGDSPQEFEAAVQRFREELLAWGGEIAEALPEEKGGFEAIEGMLGAIVHRVRQASLFKEEAGAALGKGRSQPLVEQLRERIEAGKIPLYPFDQRALPRLERVDPIEFLGRWYGEYLVFFGASQNLLFQSDLRRLDPGLLSKLGNRVQYRRREEAWEVRLEEIIPPLSEAFSNQELNRLVGARAYARRKRQ